MVKGWRETDAEGSAPRSSDWGALCYDKLSPSVAVAVADWVGRAAPTQAERAELLAKEQHVWRRAWNNARFLLSPSQLTDEPEFGTFVPTPVVSRGSPSGMTTPIS
eukprot:m.369917 g.369917  ORF g.369917 m.369917 type:complete len:106 (+) comp16680_c1_seq25:1219-1536(+)